MKILIINGPNLNMLGIREPALYGRQDYPALEEYCRTACRELSAQYSCEVECEIFQSNYEGALVEKIQQAYFDHTEGIVINPAAYTHTSVAILDALKAAAVPAAEVHLTDIREREDTDSKDTGWPWNISCGPMEKERSNMTTVCDFTGKDRIESEEGRAAGGAL